MSNFNNFAEPDTNAASEDSEPSDREVGTEDHSDDARESTTDVESSGTEETVEENILNLNLKFLTYFVGYYNL